MNGVLGMTELLMDSGLNERQTRLAETAHRSANSLLGVINNILDFSKIEAGKLQLIIKEFDLRSMLEETVEMLAEQAYRKDIELILNIPHDFNYVIQGDAERLRQVLINLLGNAIKFTETGEVQLKVSRVSMNSTSERIKLLFEVVDSGIGIDYQQQEAIFDSFTQSDGSITRRYGGTGLGLTISRQLLELMSGQMALYSCPGHGSRFYFTIEFALGIQASPSRADIQALQGINVLVIDDNATNLEIMHDQLRQWGTRVTTVDSGARALQSLRNAANARDPFKIALVDWHMPVMDGLSLSEAIQHDPGIPKLSLIMLSSESVSFLQQQRYRCGIDFYLNKPVFQHKLLHCLLDVLGNNRPMPGAVTVAGSNKRNLSGRILVAEDNVVNQEVIKGILENLGCRVDLAKDGEEAVAESRLRHYDAILMDCHMPGMDGFAATALIRQDEQAGGKLKTPIIALTADVQKGIHQQCWNSGMDAYLSKPFNKQQLYDILKNCLSDHAPLEATCLPKSGDVADSGLLSDADLSILREVTCADGGNLLDKTIDAYLKTSPDIAQKLLQALEARDVATIALMAHSLKSASASLGARAFATTCASLEKYAGSAEMARIDELAETFKGQFQAVLNALPEIAISSPTRHDSVFVEQANNAGEAVELLLVDDDPNFHLVTGEQLKAAGFKVRSVYSGEQALKFIKFSMPDLVILDALLGGIDGFETCRLMRANSSVTDVPIIMSTGLDDVESINKAFAAGASDFIIKPFNHTVLIHHIKFLLRSSHNVAELRNSKQQLAAAQHIAGLGHWTWNAKTNKFEVSPCLAELCQLEPGYFQCDLQKYLDLVDESGRSLFLETLYAVAKGERVDTIEYRLRPDLERPLIVKQSTALIDSGHQPLVAGTVQDISKQKESEKVIHHLAYFDELTGLPSRVHYQDRIRRIIKSAARHHEQFAFLFLDLDEFKYVNDSYGHNIGDQFLKNIAQRLENVVREEDFTARLGGDEFCIIAIGIGNEFQAIEIADRCLQEINKPLILEGHHFKPRVSIGIAMYPKDGDNPNDLMKAADTAMYSAKNEGKQCYAYYRPEMTGLALKRLQDEQMLREAVEDGQFELYYQPQVSMRTGRVISLEALIRWHHPERGFISPAEFIPLAETLGVIRKIGDWVIREACQQMQRWRQQGFSSLRVAVNISPNHFREPQLVDTLQEVLKRTGLPVECLELEVTESVTQSQLDLAIFTTLRAMGIKIAIDDFGTGYSSLASLKKLPIDCLKIDRVFVQDVLLNPQTPILLGAMIGIANAMDFSLVAEGVETIEQALAINGLGCDIIQGYCFSRPLPAAEVALLFDKDFRLEHKAFVQHDD